MFKASLFSSSDTNFSALGIDNLRTSNGIKKTIFEGLQHMLGK